MVERELTDMRFRFDDINIITLFAKYNNLCKITFPQNTW